MKFPTFILAACLTFTAPHLGAQDEAAAQFSERPEIASRLEAVRTEIQKLPSQANSTLRERLEALEAVCQYHMASVDILTKSKTEQKQAELEKSSWKGFPQPPPYSILLLDDIREHRAILENAQKAAEAQLRIFMGELEIARDALEEHQKAERRFMEVGDRPEDRQIAEQSAEIERVASRISKEEIARLNVRMEVQRNDLETSSAKKELTTLQLNVLKGNVSFSKDAFDAIQQRIAREKGEISRELALVGSQSKPANPLLSWRSEFLDLQKTFWDHRYAAFQKKDRATTNVALTAIKTLQNRVEDWNQIAQLRFSGGGETIVAYHFDADQLRDAMVQTHRMARLIEYTIADLKGRDRGTPLLDHVTSNLLSLWNAELYLVEETDIVDGKKIPTYRAVTLGKLFKLTLILVIGWFVLRFFSKRIKSLILRKSNIPQNAADLAGRWAFGLGLVLLLLYGLNSVRIPLTVFAFLGGALAIGVGFGTQTLLKNFISGVILLFERPLKVGDVIEVAGITGTIKMIGIRASVIQHFDGIETLVPNSILLENQLTNWTFSSTVLRHAIVIGVAYGSPTREVSRLLLGVARGHGLVKKDPEPEVRFENFGDSALTFRLLFWLDTRKIGREQLASDLRFMIDKTFADAGIVISFPQRDIHFDPETPLRVELTRASPPPRNP